MRFLLIGALALGVTGYGRSAFYFYEQDLWGEAPEIVPWGVPSDILHPEAVLGAVRNAFNAGDYSDALLLYLNRSLRAAPSFYQSTLLATVYRANRVESPELIRQGFDASVRRFPANGRLHLTFARWLLASRSPVPEEASKSIRLARTHLEKALLLEEDLVGQGLAHIRWSGVPVEEWVALLPNSLPARRQLLQTLVRSGYRAEAVALLENMLESSTEKELLRSAAGWALQWGEPQLALEAAERWQEAERASGKTGLQLARATLQVVKAHMALDAPDAAHQTYLDTLKEMGDRSRASRPARLALMNGMGYEYLRQGQTVLARSAFLKARALAPFHVDSSLGLARTYRRTGDRKSAIEQYRTVLELDRHHELAKKELATLLVGERLN